MTIIIIVSRPLLPTAGLSFLSCHAIHNPLARGKIKIIYLLLGAHVTHEPTNMCDICVSLQVVTNEIIIFSNRIQITKF